MQPTETYHLYTDGAYQPDVSIAGIGGHLTDSQGNTVFEFFKPITDPTHFKYHEAIALTYGLKKALEHGVEHLNCFADDVSIRNIFNKEVLSEISAEANPFRKDIFELKNKFKSIQFNHLPRTNNKKADKLAGKILRIYKEDILPNRTRADFIGQENKFLVVPNLICEEDYLDPVNPTITCDTFNTKQVGITNYFLMDIFKNCQTVDNIDDNNPLTVNLYLINTDKDNYFNCTLIDSKQIIQKKLISVGLEMLALGFEQYASSYNKDIGLIFCAIEQPLQKIDMLLRKRHILPMPDTPLTREFLAATSKFDCIVLDNNQEVIHQYHSSLVKNNVPVMKIKK